MGTEFQFGEMMKFWGWMVGMVAQWYESVYCYELDT